MISGTRYINQLPRKVPMLIIDQSQIEELVARPRESLNAEVKRWIDTGTDHGISIIVRACFAIRNRNGGFVAFGFDNATLLPHSDDRPNDVRTSFHTDKIQAIISRYAQEPFEVGVGFATRTGLSTQSWFSPME
jgi:hypothetical protein